MSGLQETVELIIVKGVTFRDLPREVLREKIEPYHSALVSVDTKVSSDHLEGKVRGVLITFSLSHSFGGAWRL